MNLTHALVAAGLSLAAVPATSFVLDDGKQATQKLIQQLGDKDYKTRKEAFRALEQMGEKARGELEKAAKSDDPETRWSATLLLDRLDDPDRDAPSGGLRERDAVRDDNNDVDAPRVRRNRGARDAVDPLDEIRDSLRRLQSRDPFGSGMLHDPFGDDFFRRFDDLRNQRGGGDMQMGPGSSMSRVTENDGQRESVTVKVDANGRATAEVEKNGEKTKYEADSFDQLKKEHPELFEGMGLGGMNIQVRPFGRARVGVAPRNSDEQEQNGALRPRNDDDARNEKPLRPGVERPHELSPAREPRDNGDVDALPADRPRLGVQIQPLSPEVADFLELDDGVGLEVVRVVDGSAAAQLGVKKHDVIVKVNGRTIHSDRDVAKALAGKDPAQAEVVVIRREAERTLGKKE